MDAIEDGGAENADEMVPEDTSTPVEESSGERGDKYKDGDIVWVKLNYCWWPGEVKDIPTDGAFKKPPLYIVKFFDENFFEYVRNEGHIFAYQCEQKMEFIKKSLLSNKLKDKLDKFKSDVIQAESKTNGNVDILNDPQFLPEKKVNYVADIFGTAAQRRAASAGSPKKKGGRKSSQKLNSSQSHITHRRFLGWDDFESMELVQYVGKDRKSASDDEEVQQLNVDIEDTYYCPPCNFSCHRLEIFRLHSNQHLKGIIDGKGKQKRPYHKKPRALGTSSAAATAAVSTTPNTSVLAATSEDEGSAKKKRRRSKKADKKAETAEQKRDIAKDLLTEWNEDDDDDLENILNASKENQSLNKSNEGTAQKDKHIVADSEVQSEEDIEKISEETKEIVKPAKERAKEQNKSCFDFDDDETSDTLNVSPSGSRKIPRVIPEVRKSTENGSSSNSSSNNNKDPMVEMDDDNSAAFKELMESTTVPDLPEVGAPSLLKAEQNFHSGKTIKFPDKSDDEPSKSVATKLTNPKKRFVKSFEDFEQFMNEQRRIEEEKNLQSNNSGTTMAPAMIADVANDKEDGEELDKEEKKKKEETVATAAVVAATKTDLDDGTSAKQTKKVEERATRRSSRLSRPFKGEVEEMQTEIEPEEPLDPFDALLRSSELEKRKMAAKNRGKKNADDVLKKPKLNDDKDNNEDVKNHHDKHKRRRGKRWTKKAKKPQRQTDNKTADENIDSNQNNDDLKNDELSSSTEDKPENVLLKPTDDTLIKSDDQGISQSPKKEHLDLQQEKQIKSEKQDDIKKEIDAVEEKNEEITNKIDDNQKKDDLPKFSKDSFVFTYKTRRSNYLKTQQQQLESSSSTESSKIDQNEVENKKVDEEKAKQDDKESKVDPIDKMLDSIDKKASLLNKKVELASMREKSSRRSSTRLSTASSDNSDSSDIDKKLEKVFKDTKRKSIAAEKEKPKASIDDIVDDDDSLDIDQLKSNIALKIREAAESAPSKRLGMHHRTPRGKFLESYRQEGLNSEEKEEKLDNEPKTNLITPASNVSVTTAANSSSTTSYSYFKTDKYMSKRDIWSSKARFQSPRRDNYNDGSKPRENKFFTSRRPILPPVEPKSEDKGTTNEIVEAEQPPAKIVRKSLDKSPKRDISPMQSPKRDQSPRKVDSSPKASPKSVLASPKSNENISVENIKSPTVQESVKDSFDFPQTQADLPDDLISKPKPTPKVETEAKPTNDKEEAYDDFIIDPSKKIPPIDESAILNIETNATVVSEKDLADGQVEIAAVATSKPVTVMNFSMDYAGDTSKDSEVKVKTKTTEGGVKVPETVSKTPEVVPKTVVNPQQTVLNQLVTSQFIKDPVGTEKRLSSGQKLITPTRTVPKATIALSKSIPVSIKSTLAKPVQVAKTVTLSKPLPTIIPATRPAKVSISSPLGVKLSSPSIIAKSTAPAVVAAKTSTPLAIAKSTAVSGVGTASKNQTPTLMTVKNTAPMSTVEKQTKLQNALEQNKTKLVAPSPPKSDDICDFEDHIPSQIVNKEQPKPTESVQVEETKSKATILSEKIVKPAATKRSISEVENVGKGNKKLALDDSNQKGKPKAKILQQTIITPAGEIISGAGGSTTTSTAASNVVVDEFDINSMPIVLSDEILTPESIEKMSIVLDNSTSSGTPVTTSTPVVKKALPRILNKTPMPLISKNVPAPRQRVYTTVGGNKIIKSAGPLISQKGNKYIVMQSGGSTGSPLTQTQKIIKKQPMVIRKPISSSATSSATESKGNKVMIVTNQQGQQQRLLLTPAQQKMIGYQSPAIDKSKLGVQKIQTTLARGQIATKLETSGTPGAVMKNSSTSSSLKTVAQPMKLNKSIIGKKIVVQNQSLYPADANTTQSVQKQLMQQQQQQQAKVELATTPVVKKQKTILIKNQHGQLVKKIQGTDDALLDKQVAEQIEAIKASSLAAQNRAKEAAQMALPKKQIRRPLVKKITTTPSVSTPAISPVIAASSASPPSSVSTNLPPALSPIKQQPVVAVEEPSASQQAPVEEPKPADRPLNQLVIQDAMGNQTTITEGQILALPSETVGGQPQSYMLVTLDESGNLTPLNNEALMSLDPNLVPGGDLSNMVLQIDQSGIQQAAGENVPLPENNMETVVTTSEAPTTVSNAEEVIPAVPEEMINPSVSAVEETIAAPAPTSAPVAEELANQVVGGQQLILTGDPEATQKFLESLSTNADLSNILANAEGSILIQADGQQILINTNTVPAEQQQQQQQQQLLLNVANEDIGSSSTSSAESAGNPVFSGQQQQQQQQQNKFQDILAAALADTDFQEAQKPSQLSPGGGGMYPIVPNVLDTTLALNSPIMTPLEVPSSNNKKITDEEADILTQSIPKNIDLPITITDPNISQTVLAQQQQQQVANFGNELQELALPITSSESGASTVSVAENDDKSITTAESLLSGYSLPTLDDISQKPLSSMPLLTDEEEVATETKTSEPSTTNVDQNQSFLTATETAVPASSTATIVPTTTAEEEEEGLCTLGGEMCSSLSEPPPEMFELQTRFPSSNDPNDCGVIADLGGVAISEENSNSTRSEAESSTSCEIPLQPQIEAVPTNTAAIEDNNTNTDLLTESSNFNNSNSSSSDAKFD